VFPINLSRHVRIVIINRSLTLALNMAPFSRPWLRCGDEITDSFILLKRLERVTWIPSRFGDSFSEEVAYFIASGVLAATLCALFGMYQSETSRVEFS
jgi:hypothetical protein